MAIKHVFKLITCLPPFMCNGVWARRIKEIGNFDGGNIF